MKIINKSKNTIYIEDIDFYLPYEDGRTHEVDPDLLKRSRGLRSAIISPSVDIVHHNPSERIETAIVYLKQKAATEFFGSETDSMSEPKEELPDPPSLDVIDDEIEIKFHGIFYDASGYSKVNRNVAHKLSEMGFKLQVDAKMGRNQLTENEISEFMHLERTELSRNHIRIDSVVPSFSEMGTGRYKILYTTIESYTIPNQFIEGCQFYDEIWLTSPWSAALLKEHIKDKPIHAITTGVDTELYCENGSRYDFRPNIKDFVFISVFSWNYRKGWDVLTRAYFDEFSEADNVSLMIVSRYQSGRSKHEKNKPRTDIETIMDEFPNKDLPHLVRYGKVIREQDMPKLYRSANCFVLPTRGEGGGLPPLEASMCGLPVIMTNCSGQQMYLRPDNSYMLEFDRLEEVRPGQMKIHYWDGQKFPAMTSPDVHNQLRQIMRSVVNDYAEAQSRNKRLQKLIMDKYTWNHTAILAADRLKEIHRQLKGGQ
jgi:glycosyltransferase involved in cell wall biosynthesis